MKTQALFACSVMLCLCITMAKRTMAQEQANAPASRVISQIYNGRSGDYTFRVFMAPNKTYGYDIFNNGKLIYHQPAFSRAPASNDLMITKREQGDAAAMLAIEKLKRGTGPALTNDELKAVISH